MQQQAWASLSAVVYEYHKLLVAGISTAAAALIGGVVTVQELL
jgi:hypothetical protein